ncbi:MAG: T9SS type A sorting domain-containing protein, partial [Balneolaceae bacterium]|nr:T9SS type A sorting domain-containing protein [Balneolaceae bacterium]
PAQSRIVFGGDGGYTYFAPSYLLVSAQNGQVARLSVDSQNNPTNFGAIVHPRGATEQLFVHPYVLDPNDETVLYYPGSNSNLGRQFIWRNTEIDQISNSNSDGATQGWEQLTNFDVPSGYVISNLAVSKVPADILYFAGSDGDPTDNNNLEPLLFRVNNAKTSTSGKQELFSANIDTSFSGVPRGAYIHNLALNPVNANELLVVMSNYNITGIFHSDDGGQNWSSVEGNLTGDALNPGPSIRSATIIPGETETVYIVATSTGVFSTTTLDGTNTSWVRESPGGIGFAVSEFVTSRSSDGDVAVGTHGRGIFLGEFTGTTITPSFTLTPAQARAGEQVAITASNFTFSSDPLQNSVLFGGQEAVVTEASSNSITVIVPRREQAGGSSSASVEVQISVEGGPTFGGVSFTYIPPEQFELLQNYPNPFNLTTNIPFNLGQRSVVIVQVYDITGRKVIEPISETFDSGSWSQPVNLDGLASGIYFYRVLVFPLDAGGNVVSQSPQIIESKKMTLVK